MPYSWSPDFLVEFCTKRRALIEGKLKAKCRCPEVFIETLSLLKVSSFLSVDVAFQSVCVSACDFTLESFILRIDFTFFFFHIFNSILCHCFWFDYKDTLCLHVHNNNKNRCHCGPYHSYLFSPGILGVRLSPLLPPALLLCVCVCVCFCASVWTRSEFACAGTLKPLCLPSQQRARDWERLR